MRDALFQRLTGSPDPYGKQIDGMGAGSSSTSKVVVVSRSERTDCDVDYLFGAVGIDQAMVDWSGNCGNLCAAVGPFALHRGLLPCPSSGLARVRIWQANIGKRIIAHVPVERGEVVEDGGFTLDGVAFPAAEIRLDFLDPAGGEGSAQLFPTGRPVDLLQVPGEGECTVTLINAGNPTVFVEAQRFGLDGTETQARLNADRALLNRLEAVRAHAAVAMGLAENAADATLCRPGTPKLAWVAPPRAYKASHGAQFGPEDFDVAVRILSMGAMHHAITGTGAVAVAAAAALEGTLVQASSRKANETEIRIGHPSGVLPARAEVAFSSEGNWVLRCVSVSRSARRLMEGNVWVPAP